MLAGNVVSLLPHHTHHDSHRVCFVNTLSDDGDMGDDADNHDHSPHHCSYRLPARPAISTPQTLKDLLPSYCDIFLLRLFSLVPSVAVNDCGNYETWSEPLPETPELTASGLRAPPC